MAQKVWFITGTSTGFGALLTRKLLDIGEKVVATARRRSSFRQYESYDKTNLITLEVDVTRTELIKSAVEDAVDHFGGIDVLVNNAGYGYFATVEEGSMDEIRMMYDVNLFGLIEMTQAVLPIMRERGGGTIVNMSSIGGRIPTARGAFYQGSKWAIEALSEALYIETHPFGIRVLVLEPGSYDTDFGPRSTRNTPSPNGSPYLQFRENWIKGRASIFPELQDPAEVIDRLITAVEEGKGFDRIPIGNDAISTINLRDREGWAVSLEDIKSRYTGG